MVQVVFVVLVAQVVLVGYMASEAQLSWTPRAMDRPEGLDESSLTHLVSLIPPAEPLLSNSFCFSVYQVVTETCLTYTLFYFH